MNVRACVRACVRAFACVRACVVRERQRVGRNSLDTLHNPNRLAARPEKQNHI